MPSLQGMKTNQFVDDIMFMYSSMSKYQATGYIQNQLDLIS